MGTNIGEMFDIEKLRYHKIIIMTDADVDGSHIRTLLLTLFFRYFPEIITGGYLYIAQPPLYSVKEGKTVHWMYTDEDLTAYKQAKGIADEEAEMVVVTEEGEEDSDIDTSDETNKKRKKLALQRYKGLGEMNPEQLWNTTMNPESRMLKIVTVEDAEAANEVFDILMGSDVAPRKKFIQTHAKSVTNLDV
jgi:DNA gyrase subunit B